MDNPNYTTEHRKGQHLLICLIHSSASTMYVPINIILSKFSTSAKSTFFLPPQLLAVKYSGSLFSARYS